MKALLLILTLCVSATAFAQYNQKSGKGPKGPNSASALPLSERVYFGGGGGFGAGTDANGLRYSYISISPLVGYRITLPWSAGLQLIYQTYNFSQIKQRYNQYGFAPFTQYRFGQLFAYGEYQVISAPRVTSDGRAMYSRLPLGIGFTQPIGTRAAINAVALYDVLWNSQRQTSPFLSPWVLRVYVTAGGISF
jgi:hypothetical protein